MKGTAKKTRTNSLWIILNYAMRNSLIFYHRYLILYAVSVSVSGFQIPCFSAAGFFHLSRCLHRLALHDFYFV